MDSHMSTELVVDTLRIAVWRTKPAAGLVHYSDQAVHYASISSSRRLREVGLQLSVGRTGSALDNAMVVRFDFQGGVGEQDELSESAGPPRVPASSTWGLLQHPPAALGTGPQEPRRFRGG